jgi:hypothetical protein
MMALFRSVHSNKLKRLQLRLKRAGRLLDQIEERALSRRTGAIATPERQSLDNPETRFAACVVSGMSKIQSPLTSDKQGGASDSIT